MIIVKTFRVGDPVVIKGWHADKREYRRVVAEVRSERGCQSGVMVKLDRPLPGGPRWVDAAWVQPCKPAAKLYEDLILLAAGCGFLVYLLVSVAVDLVALVISGIASIGRALNP